MALAVPLSRFTSRIGGGSAFFVRPHYAFMKPSRAIALVALGLLIGFFVGWHFGFRDLKARREETIQNLKIMMMASKIYSMAYSNSPAAVTELLTNLPVTKP